jgi:antitoxin YefM
MRWANLQTVTVNQFRDSLREHVEKVLADHEPLKVTRRSGGAFVVVGAEDWEREQETLYVLQNRSLMDQIARSAQTHAVAAGYSPTKDELDEIHRL